MRAICARRVEVAVVAAAALLVPAGAQAAETASQAFTVTGEHMFVVPVGVTSLQVTLVGGSGASGGLGNSSFHAPGGTGGTAIATLTVSPGQTLFAEVAGNGQTNGNGGYGGGGAGTHSGETAGGGGGASDVRTCSATASPSSCSGGSSIASRLVVAAGGGGGGRGGADTGDSVSIKGGTGGEGDAPGGAGAFDPNGDNGGDGGQQGGANSSGAGGEHSAVAASPGELGVGGNGGTSFAAAGGGGGGGVFGGGGGGGGLVSEKAGKVFNSAGGGGGGGGSGVPAGASGVPAFTREPTVSGTEPSVTLSWTLPPPAASTGAPTALSATTATLNGAVNPDGSSVGDCHFVVSPVPPSGALLPCSQQVGAGSTPVAVSASLIGLSPATSYTVTLVASSAQGTSAGARVPFVTPIATAPSSLAASIGGGVLTVSGLKLSPSRFRRGKHFATLSKTGTRGLPTATTISFALSAAGSVMLTFERPQSGMLVGHKCSARTKAHRRNRSCTRYVRASGAVRRSAHPGADGIRFEGVLDGGKALAPGTYRLSLAASAAGATTTATQHPTFTLAK
jgi:Glycine rich protein